MNNKSRPLITASIKEAAAFLFILGSILFYWTTGPIYNAGVSLFVIGSILFFISAVIEIQGYTIKK